MELKNTEKQEHSVVALTIEITKAEFEAAKDKAFKKTGKNITVPGFRKGKAPRKMIEKLYGEGVFFEEAFNIILPKKLLNDVSLSFCHYYFVYRFLFSSCHNKRPPMIYILP